MGEQIVSLADAAHSARNIKMKIFIFLSLLVLVRTEIEDRGLWNLLQEVISIAHETYVPEDAVLNISQLATKYNYPFEQHEVHTVDGYILNIHRIRRQNDGPVVFLMHGILESSDSWLLLGPGKALAYVLADQGFDVWMGNARGNKHSNRHVSFNTSMSRFWEFTWEEIGVNDVPAMISYVLEVTKQRALYYVGHSQGTTSGYVMCSMLPQYNNYIKMMFSLAPEAWMGNVRSPLVRMFSPAYNILGQLLKDFNAHTSGIDVFNKISAFVCSVSPGKCDNIVFALSGYETKINETLLAIVFGHMPTGASTYQFVHYGQLVESKRFCRFDFGTTKNFEVYKNHIPPDYNLKNIITPVVLFHSLKDLLSDPRDVNILKHHLPNMYSETNLSDYTHLDYVYADDAKDVIYSQIISHINKFESNTYLDVKHLNHEPEEVLKL